MRKVILKTILFSKRYETYLTAVIAVGWGWILFLLFFLPQNVRIAIVCEVECMHTQRRLRFIRTSDSDGGDSPYRDHVTDTAEETGRGGGGGAVPAGTTLLTQVGGDSPTGTTLLTQVE